MLAPILANAPRIPAAVAVIAGLAGSAIGAAAVAFAKRARPGKLVRIDDHVFSIGKIDGHQVANDINKKVAEACAANPEVATYVKNGGNLHVTWNVLTDDDMAKLAAAAAATSSP